MGQSGVTDRYPILVENLGKDKALVIACQACSWEATITPDDIRNERDYSCPRCLGPADYKYEEADHKCPNCGTLGFFPPSIAPCCSRVCTLQWQYAKQLTSRGQSG